MRDTIYRQDAVMEIANHLGIPAENWMKIAEEWLRDVLSVAQPERLTDDDFETIRIHLNAYKEKLCNQQRWKEAEEYQRIIDRFMAFASARQEIIHCKDCVYWDSLPSSLHTEYHECVKQPFHTDTAADEFCSRAERRQK